MPNLVTESVANDEERARLGLFPGEMVLCVDRIRDQGEHALVEHIRLVAALFPRLEKPVPSIGELADSYGLQLGEALETVSTVLATPSIAKALHITQGSGLPHVAVPETRLESGCHWPASGLTGAQRRAEQMLAARSSRVLAGDSRAKNAVSRHCSAVATAR